MGKRVTIEQFSQFVTWIEMQLKGGNVIFRGQREDKPLIPKIGRINLIKPLNEVENKLLFEFKRQSYPLLELQPSNDWDWLSLMQHHGLPTRLLDWTFNAFAALWFAVQKPANGNNPGVVWVYEVSPQDLIIPNNSNNPFEGKRTTVFQPMHVTSRIVAQSGCFTVHKFIQGKNKFIPLNNNKSYIKNLHKMKIPAEVFPDLRLQLNRFGINSTALFPDLDGLSQHLEWLNTILSDEKKSSFITVKTEHT